MRPPQAREWRPLQTEATVFAPIRACPAQAPLEAPGLSELEIVPAARTGSSQDGLAVTHVSAEYGAEPLLRRLLAMADVFAISAAAAIVGLWGSGVSGALLLVLSAPIWLVTAKLAGLYGRDHRTLRHLTVDELPWLLVWTLSSTALLTLLLAPFPALDLSSDDPLLVWATAPGLGFSLRAGALAAHHATPTRAHRRRRSTGRRSRPQARALPRHPCGDRRPDRKLLRAPRKP